MTPRRDQIKSLMQWEFQTGVDFWTNAGPKRATKVMVSPGIEKSFADFLAQNKIEHKILINDVEPTLQHEKESIKKSRAKRSVLDDGPNFSLYWTFEEMETYSIRLAQQYPHIVKREVIGKSIEGRDMFALKVSSGATFGKKPIIFIDTGTHAREWIGPHTTLYFINQLVTNAAVTTELLDKVDYVFIPNVNPDGYVYTHTEDRFWRKNRRYVNYTCTGVDLNRNYAYLWEQVPYSVSSHRTVMSFC